MAIQRVSAPLALTMALALVPWAQPAKAQNRQLSAVSGIVQLDGSCPGTSYILADCPCLNPTVLYHLDSIKLDLAVYVGHFVTLRGTVRAEGCRAPFFEVRKATIEPDRPCPCPASGAVSESTDTSVRQPGLRPACAPAGS